MSISSRPPKPKALPVRAAAIPAQLKQKPQWVLWAYEWSDKKGRWDKPPLNPHDPSKHTSSTDPSTWTTIEDVMALYGDGSVYDGIGFMPMPEDNLSVWDLDHCRDSKTTAKKVAAMRIVEEIDSYTEISPSGNGLRIIASGRRPDRERSKNGPVEIFDGMTKEGKPGGKYLTITGCRLKSTPKEICERQQAVTEVYLRELKRKRDPKDPWAEQSECVPKENATPKPSITDLTDDEIIEQAGEARNGGKFKQLWNGDFSGYPSASEGVSALCYHLAFWSRDPKQIDRLFRRSGLYRDHWRDQKWERLGNGTIQRALEATAQDDYRASEPEAKGEAPRKRPTRSTRLVEYAREVLELFHSPEGQTFATAKERPRATWSLRSKAARQYLARLFHQREGAAAGSEVIATAITTLEGLAVFDGPVEPVYIRVGTSRGKIYLDLGTDDWSTVRIGADGWEVVQDYPVKIRRARGTMPLPAPVRGGNVEELRPFVNLFSNSDWRLLIGWLLAAFSPTGPYPVLCLAGEQGAAKSTLARVVRGLVDPNSAPLRAEPRNPHDLIIAGSNSWVVALDNLSYLQPWLSDALCRLSTGGGFSTRELYSDADEILFDAQRPVIVNGIEEVVTRPDLLERSLVLTLPTIPEEDRRAEKEFWSAYSEVQPRVLGSLLDVVSAGLGNLATVQLDRLPRMADFAKWVTACEPSLAWKSGAFLRAYAGNVRNANELVLESSPVVRHVMALIDGGRTWEGTAAELLTSLDAVANEGDKRLKSWPKTPRALAGIVRRMAPNFRRAGISVQFSRQGHECTRTISIFKERPETPSASSARSAALENRASVQTVADANAKNADGRVAPPDGSSGKMQTQNRSCRRSEKTNRLQENPVNSRSADRADDADDVSHLSVDACQDPETPATEPEDGQKDSHEKNGAKDRLHRRQTEGQPWRVEV
jgi:hypothetical protein